ncbi:UDP-2,3-diacylglucosamine diphosphatase [Thorsellia anophelis]|uniref:UDP-2,3-diacylglucosamine hydrolase n=1 Tax=Thorsellia anophelis DSM 18579 TaxID=1123402 RepID=A0A1I0AGQ1_9GAMM|nr:UDP-2,3-diacylglucosamine diphosphatase [Thorsellia anophelis]SES93475.1 UDP-2,3-diacylglucosamine hydrolase [Thorsellia anophelis DSM 18579]
MIKPIYVIADLHLSELHPEITDGFLAFLKRAEQESSALYILGDLFDAWIGDDNMTPLNTLIAQSIKKLSAQGVNCYFMPGNRDFLLGQSYAKRCGMILIKETSYPIHVFGHSIRLLHGDILCTDDISYQRYRKIVHNPIVQWLFTRLSLNYRKHLANRLRQKSQSTNQFKPHEIMDVNMNAVAEIVKRYHLTHLIHGHTHRPGKHTLGDLACDRIVSGAWESLGWVIKISDEIELESFPLIHDHS